MLCSQPKIVRASLLNFMCRHRWLLCFCNAEVAKSHPRNTETHSETLDCHVSQPGTRLCGIGCKAGKKYATVCRTNKT